jgi:FeS assembly protein IscX
MGIKWTDIRLISEAIYDAQPDVHPLSVRFSDLHKWILAIDAFEGNPEAVSESKLEAIQLLWYQEWKEDNPDLDDPYDFSNN